MNYKKDVRWGKCRISKTHSLLLKTQVILLAVVFCFGCHEKQQKNGLPKVEIIETEAPVKIEKIQETNIIPKDQIKKFVFDKSEIPSKLIKYVHENMDSLHIPNEDEYNMEYFAGSGRLVSPYYCSGYFDNDSIKDYAIVLVKDSTAHFVFSFHSKQDSFKVFQLCESPFLVEYGEDKAYAIYDLKTETERSLEAIDTTYQINTDGITITDICESRTKVFVFDSLNCSYNELLFD